jgi:hypothetical protein
MRKIPLSASLLVFWQNLVFLEGTLLAHPETKDLAEPVTKTLDEFTSTLKVDLDTRRGVLQGQAKGVIADGFIDEALRGLFSATLHLVNQDRKQPEFSTLFSTHIGDVVRYALKRQVEVAVDIVRKLGMNLYTKVFRDAQAAAIEPRIADGQAVLEEQRKAELARTEARLEIRAWKEDVNAICTSIQGDLLKIASKTKRGKDWVEAFFLRKGSAAAEDDEPTEPGGEG